MSVELLKPQGTPRPGVGIVHLGLGAFFRAFGIPWIAEAMETSGGDWGVVGVSLRSPTVRNALAPQGFAYTAAELAPSGGTLRVIETVQDVLVAPEDPLALLDRMSDPMVKLVTLTITEKGYCHNPATGTLNPDHPDIRADLAGELPKSAVGFIVRALQRRKAAGRAPFTVLSCDNLPENGRVTRGVVLELAEKIDPELAAWIAEEGRFPCSMVDRIVPATTDDDIARLEAETGRHDAGPVMHEPFRQWVIEDDFVNGERPDFGAVGVQMVSDVVPFEHMKLRMLNAAHSSMAYLGYLAGHETISAVACDPVFSRFVEGLWKREIIPALAAPEGVDLEEYAAQLLERFRNPAIRHRTWQIAMDGSQKLPQRILATLEENHANGRPSPGLELAVAGWMRYVGGVDEKGEAIDVQDPLAERLRALSDGASDENRVQALLSVREVFSSAQAVALEPGVAAAYDRLLEVGARNAVGEI
ncbi:fructuronate reductase [Aliiruegeria haliotis]|uniref:Fructuronate reductase n=1 Tax=Aliiruegeria haliotis TaxID=1280846 RepID=A0A2T0RTC4_9RHOB|nr:mannitol dehydrogenase family protein [Aliiruegeria haliotis]PRY24445.1 fructuronate reductase [Aliiruegeria haliotis]